VRPSDDADQVETRHKVALNAALKALGEAADSWPGLNQAQRSGMLNAFGGLPGDLRALGVLR